MEGDHNDIYRECLRNHAASLGSYATDGCGEFTLDDTHPSGGLNCAACGCHRNFHRKVSRAGAVHYQQDVVGAGEVAGAEIMDYGGRQQSPPESSSGKKRFRTKFSEEQKEKMLGFAEKLGWRLQRREAGDEEDEIERFCRGVGISRKVFKVWMHNHKNSPSPSHSAAASTGNASSLTDHL